MTTILKNTINFVELCRILWKSTKNLPEKYGLFVNLEKIYNKNVEKNRMGGLDMNKINVAIADDNQRTVEMMTELLEQESDIEVIASADNGEDALRIIKERQPDVVLLDIIMPKLDGIGVIGTFAE